MPLQITAGTLQVTVNKLERRHLDGKEYAVAPVVALVAGVRNGELVPSDELAAFAAAWNGRPIPLRHPQDTDGNYISANDPSVIEAQVIGQVFNMAFEADRLTGELWLDVAKAQALGGDALATLKRLDAGKTVEVSTAYFCDVEAGEGTFNGLAYTGIQHNLRPDHVALLPDEIGACSLADGCGANVKANALDFKQSIMAAFYLKDADAQALALNQSALPEGSTPLPPGDLHVTLAYLGEITDMAVEFNRVAQVLANYASDQVMVMADVSGMGRFANAETGLDAVFLLLDSESLHRFRFWLADLLAWDLGLDQARPWGYIPHVTLAYVPTTDAVQLAPVAPRNLVFDRLALSWGDQTIVFPLLGELRNADAVSANRCSCSEETMNEQEKKQAAATKVPPKANDDGASTGDTVQDGAAIGISEEAEITLPALPPELTELAEAIRQFGGVAQLMQAVSGIKANNDRQKADVVARLSANSRCAFSKSDLEAMSLEQIGKLEQSIAPRSYVGQGGAVQSAGQDEELRVYKGADEKGA